MFEKSMVNGSFYGLSGSTIGARGIWASTPLHKVLIYVVVPCLGHPDTDAAFRKIVNGYDGQNCCTKIRFEI